MIGPYTIEYLLMHDYDPAPLVRVRLFDTRNALGPILNGSPLIPLLIKEILGVNFADTFLIKQLEDIFNKLEQVGYVILNHLETVYDGLGDSDGQLWAARFLDLVQLVAPHLDTMEELFGQLQVVENREGVIFNTGDSKKQWEYIINIVHSIKRNYPWLRRLCSDRGFELYDICAWFPQRLAQDIVSQGAEGQDLSDLKLGGCDLSGANLKNATLKGTVLHQANLSEANLSGANLDGANLYGANLQGTRYNSDTIWPEGFNPDEAGVILVGE